ncbi:MAG: penicillin-binding protein 2 [Chloroflexi bacterium]|nr:penicillin-binding protein 2 [Chloroflexota bacterium]MDA0244902.1 penicillin-binding protein 2 [Chloroflexota bacterium]
MNENQTRRMWVVAAGFIFATLIIIGRLVVFQVVESAAWEERGRLATTLEIIARPERGIIYDSNGTVLAANGADYQIGASPALIINPEEVATQLAPILNLSRYDILALLESNYPFVTLSGRVSAEVAEAIRALDYDGLQIDPMPRRIYPQGELLCHVLGYTDFDGIGGAGLEGYYQAELAGEAARAQINISPLTQQENVIAREGSDLVLTIDRTVQHTVEEHLRNAISQYRAESGTIIVMDPRTGAIVAMANWPCYDPYRFYEADRDLLQNPAISQQYEPGSVMKVVTMAAALDSGAANLQSTYYDSGVIELGGYPMYNWDRSAPGTTTMSTILARSLNVGAATLAVWMGTDTYYTYMERFNFGRRTGIDLAAEAAGQMLRPGDELWTETSLGTNSFGQGMATTPLQMLLSVSALANDGYLMQPYVVEEIRTGNQVLAHQPTVLSRPIRPEIAHQVTAMAVNAVNTEVWQAQLAGYTVAGKTGTAQIPENGIYHATETIASFVGWFPADKPELVVLIKLDRPQASPWGSDTAAPTFMEMATDLVVLMGIPPDDVRLQADILAIRDDQ